MCDHYYDAMRSPSLPQFADNDNFIFMKRGILQFVLVRPLISLVTILCKFCGVYDEGVVAGNDAYIYLASVSNVSVCVSMYYLLLFYMTIRHDIASHKPMVCDYYQQDDGTGEIPLHQGRHFLDILAIARALLSRAMVQ
jgi:hypothetical protein